MKDLAKKMVILGAGGVVLGFILLVLVYALPKAAMKEHASQSAMDWYGEGAWPILVNDYNSSTLDNFTDSLMLSIAVYDSGEPILKQVAKAYYALQEDVLPHESLYRYLQEDAQYDMTYRGEDYAKYWHGYLVVLKPLLMLLSYSDLRVLNICMLVLLTGYVFVLMENEIAKGAGSFFLLAYIFIMPLTVFLCLDMANMSYVTLLALIVLLKKKRYLCRGNNILLYFMAVGMLTSYVDFLTYPMVSLGIPLVTYLVLLIGKEETASVSKKGILSIVFWGMGYIGMWASKWVVAGLITGDNILRDALSSVKTRSGMRVEENHFEARFEAIGNNVEILCQGIYGKILFVFMAYVFGTLLWNVLKKKAGRKCLWSFLVVALIPFGWLFVTSQHAAMHAWFTYRNLIVSIYALGMLAYSTNIIAQKH